MSVSSSALTSLVLAGSLAGCMKIYPDPELPDVDVQWDGECQSDTTTVHVALLDWESEAVLHEQSTACEDRELTFEDVARERFRVKGTIFEGDAEVDHALFDVDLRDGLGETVHLYFGGFNSFSASWVFADGASCDSVGARWGVLDLQFEGNPDAFPVTSGPCENGILTTIVSPGRVRVRIRAETNDGRTVATSPLSELIVIPPGGITDAGTFTLTP